MNARLAHFLGPNQPLEIVEAALPDHLADGELLLRIDLAAVCGSDLHTTRGRRDERTPCTLGHEGVGTVLRSARPSVELGAQVTWSLVDSCGRCRACTSDALPQKCESLWKYGHGGPGLDGTYATHLLVRSGTTILELPEQLDPRLAATANCALATAEQAVRAAPEADDALVLGGGLVGLFGAYLLQSRGWSVTLVDSNPRRREAAESVGIRASATPAGKVRLVLEAAGHAGLLHSAYPCLRPGGSLLLVGLVHPKSDLALTAEDIVRRCWTVRGSHNYDPAALASALSSAVAFQSHLPNDAWGPAVPLDEVNEALDLTEQGRFLRVFVQP